MCQADQYHVRMEWEIDMKPHNETKYWQADQIAECLPVSTDTYKELWNKIVPLYDKKPRGECPGDFVYPVADYWNLLSEEAQQDICNVLTYKYSAFEEGD